MLGTDKNKKPPSLECLCLQNIAKHLEDFLNSLFRRTTLPPHIKLAVAAIARRRNLLNDAVIVKLVDSTWEFLDLSGTEVTNISLWAVASICSNIRAMDLSRCTKITGFGVSQLMKHCSNLEILIWGGCPMSDDIARESLSSLKPKLFEVEADSWEEPDITEYIGGPQALRWLVWPNIDKDSLAILSKECPHVIVNPKPPNSLRNWMDVPKHALPGVVLDESILEGIDPKTLQVPRFNVDKIELPIDDNKDYISAPIRPRRQQPPPLHELSGVEFGELLWKYINFEKLEIVGPTTSSPFENSSTLEAALEEREL